MAVSGDTVVVGARGEDSGTTGVNSTPDESAIDSGAAFVFVRSGSTWSQQAYLKSSNTGAGDDFGSAVAVAGDTVVVGASGEDSSTTGVNSTPNESASASGAAYVFIRSGSTWSPQAYLKSSNTGASDLFGGSVAVSGDTVVVGARFEDSSTTGVNSTPNESANDSGAAYVFVRNGLVWSQQAYLKAANTRAGYNFGVSVAMSGDTMVVGASAEGSSTTGVNSTPNNSGNSSGAAYVFVSNGTIWSQQAYLKASNTGAGDNFGGAVAVSGDTVVVGAYHEDSSTTGVNSTPDEGAPGSGAAYVFVRSSIWSQQAYLKASNPGEFDFFGTTVAVSDDTVVVGAYREDSSMSGVDSTPDEGGSDSGASYIFTGLGLPDIAMEAPTGTAVLVGASIPPFGPIYPGQSADLSLTLRNDGVVELGGIAATITGPDAGQFSLPGSVPSSLAAGTSSGFGIRFTPTSGGAKTATLSIASDDPDENPFTLTLTGTVALPTVSVAAAPESVAEDGVAILAYTLTRNGPTAAPLTVDFAVSGSAAFGTDYTQSGADSFSASAGSVTFASGSVTALVTLDPTADAGFEAEETAILTLSPGAGYEIGLPAAATGTILNDDTEVTLAVAPASMAEDAAGTLDITFTRAGPVAAPLTVGFTVGGTAGFGSGYTQSGAVSFSASSGTVTFAAGAATATVSIDPTADLTVELNETVILTAASGSGYQLGADVAVSGMILNDDTVVPVQFPASSSVPLTLNGFNATGHTVSTATLGFQPTTGMILKLLNNTSANPIAGAFDNLPDGGFLSATFGGRNYVMIADYTGGDGNDITLTVVPSGGTGVNPISFTMLPPARVALGFRGTPDTQYQVQRSVHLSAWTPIATIISDGTGALGFIDESPPPGRAFYRVARVSNFWGNGSDGSLTTTGNLSFASAQDGDVVVKQFTNLTINAGHTVTTSNRCRGLVIYVDGDCTINGTLSMTARGANVNPTLADSIPATGIRLVRFKSGGTETLAASDLGGAGAGGVGAVWRGAEAAQAGTTGNGVIYTIAREGGAGGSTNHSNEWWDSVPGSPGGTNPNGTGGGGGGNAAGGWSGYGSAGTCFSGGSGGGGVRTQSYATSAGSGGAYGGAGGYASWTHPHAEGGGGAGNPGGAGLQPGQSGTGGLLVLLVKGNLSIGTGGQVVSQGSNGGSAYQSGGGSGGGRIIILHAGTYSAVTPPSATGGTGGGAGGAGAITIDHIDP